MLEFKSEEKAWRMIKLFLLSSLPSLILAGVYVFVGMPLNGHDMYGLIDRYVFALSGAIGVSLTTIFYYMHHKDFTETLAVGLNVLYWLFLGAEDVFVYLICLPIGKCSYPQNLDWITVMDFISQSLGRDHVTFPFLLGWVIWSSSVVFLINYGLYRIDLEQL